MNTERLGTGSRTAKCGAVGGCDGVLQRFDYELSAEPLVAAPHKLRR